MTHVYSACRTNTATVTAIVDGVVCGAQDKLFIKGGIPYGNPCMRETYTFTKHKETVNGKKVKLCARIRKNLGGTESIFKNVFKWRVDGSKAIKSVGYIYKSSANNSVCLEADVTSEVPDKQQMARNGTGKKNLRVLFI